ncbi:MAG: nitrate ABC transporter substrate-binding protein [Nanoarchaeota archaeon]|nr:nitrate ABC transporter substrate-binding protein [Nanoarchaeota archaeon]
MKTLIKFSSLFLFLFLFAGTGFSQHETLQPKPLTLSGSKGQVKSATNFDLPIILWGGDLLTILTQQEGFFSQAGLNISLYREDVLEKQANDVLTGRTPYLRGTLAMVNLATDALLKKGVELEVIYQLTWSAGGDAMVVRPGKNIKNIKKVALQLYGPHMDYAAKLFRDAGRLNDVQFVYYKELTFPTYDSKGKIVDPVTAFLNDKTLDAVMCIIPDALLLTSGGTGTGKDNSVKGAKILLSTKSASRIIADVYATRKDYKNANPDKVNLFVNALMKGEESLRDLKKSKGAKWTKLLSFSSSMLFDTPTMAAETEGLLGDCEFAGFNGNVSFFTGTGTTRNLKNLNSEIQSSFKSMGLIAGSFSLNSGNLDYNSLASGLKYASVKEEKPKYNVDKVQKVVENKISSESENWDEEGTLFSFEIYFEPNQVDFNGKEYEKSFKKVIEMAQTYYGALLIIEGHTEPTGIKRAEDSGTPKKEVEQMKQVAKNQSLERAEQVKNYVLSYAKKIGLKVDHSQFIPAGLSINSPKFSVEEIKSMKGKDFDRAKRMWEENRRVVFRVKQMETESSDFDF